MHFKPDVTQACASKVMVPDNSVCTLACVSWMMGSSTGNRIQCLLQHCARHWFDMPRGCCPLLHCHAIVSTPYEWSIQSTCLLQHRHGQVVRVSRTVLHTVPAVRIALAAADAAAEAATAALVAATCNVGCQLLSCAGACPHSM
jgi:hypothetical protein